VTAPDLGECPSWSPDGRHILLQSDRDAGGARGRGGIFIVDADGGHMKRVF
jgi:Tol biopolymer transport system component